MSKPYENIFEYLEVQDPEDDEENIMFYDTICWMCGSFNTPMYGPARLLTSPDCRSGWWVTVCVDCGGMLEMHP
jgi:hypothetical protein